MREKLSVCIAEYFIVAYAGRIYRNRVRLAKKLHKKNKTRYYVALDYSNNKNLVVMNRKGFRTVKRLFKIYYSPQMSTPALKEGAYYFTPNAIGKDGMTPVEEEARRLAFLRYMVKRAGFRY